MSSGAEVVFNTIVPPGVSPFLEQLHDAGFSARGGQLVCTYFDENFLNMVPAAHVEGLYSCLDYYQAVSDPFSEALLRRYDERFPGAAKFTGGGACSGLYRGMKLWEAAVKEAGTLAQDDVIRALDHAKIAEGPGGPAADGARPAPRADEHVHRPGRGRPLPASSRTSAPSSRTRPRCRSRRRTGARRRLNQSSSPDTNHHNTRRHDHDAGNDEGGRF